MTVIVIGSVAGAPGATRLAVGLAAAWPVEGMRRVVVEADPDGGRLGAELGVGVEPGLMALALAARAAPMTPDDLLERGATDVADWFVVAAPPSAEQAHSALVHAASSLAEVMHRDPARTAWIIDAGRLSTRSPSMAFARDVTRVVLVTHGSFPHLQLLPHRIEALRSAECHVEVVVVEPTSWSAGEIADFVAADVIGVLPEVRPRRDDLAAMSTSAWRPWWAAVDDVAAYVARDTAAPPEQDVAVHPDEAVRS